MVLSVRCLYILSFGVMQGIVCGDQMDSCDFKNTKLQVCEGSNDYLKAYPATFIGKIDNKRVLEIKTTLTFLNLARFDEQEKSVTVFVSLMTEWNDTRLSLITDR
jgi:hypothetical protein